MSQIHKSACIDPTAVIADNVSIGPFSCIGPQVEVGSGCKLLSHVVVHSNTKLGANNIVHSHAVIGGDPQDLGYQGEPTWLEIGESNVIREYVSINRGSTKEDGITKLGNNNCILAYSHIAHDCSIGNNVLFVNNATLAGHVIIDDFAIVGAFSTVHQFCHIGEYSFLARAAQANKDVPPYMMVVGTPGKSCGLNLVGLRRHGFNRDAIRALKMAYSLLYGRDISLNDALDQILALGPHPELRRLVDFIRQSKRGISRRTVDDSSSVTESP